MSEAVVIAHFEEGGTLPTFHVVGGNVRLIIVDENSPNDRVYEILRRDDPLIVSQLVPEGSVIGSSEDDRHEAIANRILSDMEGRPRLTVVTPESKT